MKRVMSLVITAHVVFAQLDDSVATLPSVEIVVLLVASDTTWLL